MIVRGKVQSGQKVGRTIGYPTINIPYDSEQRGIFVGEVFYEGKLYKAAIHLGEKPTFDSTVPVCEAFLLDFDETIDEGEEVEVKVKDKIRDIEKFENLEDLKVRISQDVEFVQSWYNERRNNLI